MSTPPTPVHPGPNEEVSHLPTGVLPESMLDDLELNPDLYDDDDDDSHQNRSSDSSFVDVELNLEQITVPFDTALQLLQTKFDSNTTGPITQQQQSKFVNYVDQSLLQIQRHFIKNQAEESEIYSLQQLLQDLQKVLDFILVPISRQGVLFGQTDYLVRILSDLEDYIAHYPHIFEVAPSSPVVSRGNYSKLIGFLTFFQNLDVALSFLIDGYDVLGHHELLSTTQLIRLIPIVSRLRILVISKIDPVRLKLLHTIEVPGDAQLVKEAQTTLNLLDVEMGRLLEGVLERSNS